VHRGRYRAFGEVHMKRDMDLARRILEEIEVAPFDGGEAELDLPDASEEAIQYHLLLLTEAGLIDTIDASTMGGPHFIPRRLTWNGHEFLEASRDDTLWQRAKSTVQNKTGGLAFDVLLAVLKDQAKRAVFGPDGG
jgi:hypothetical protein